MKENPGVPLALPEDPPGVSRFRDVPVIYGDAMGFLRFLERFIVAKGGFL